jgi:hypothetical protein
MDILAGILLHFHAYVILNKLHLISGIKINCDHLKDPPPTP